MVRSLRDRYHPKTVGFHREIRLNMNFMSKLITPRNLTIINFSIVIYFILIGLIHYFKIDFVLMGVLIELLTIPFLIAQIVFLVIGIKQLINGQKNRLTFISVLTLAICSIITISGFF